MLSSRGRAIPFGGFGCKNRGCGFSVARWGDRSAPLLLLARPASAKATMSTNRHLNQGKRKKEKGTKQTKAYSSPFFLLPFAFCLLLLPGRLPAEDAGWLDLRHTLLARQTLLDDSKLAPLDLGVRVR